MTFWAGEKVHLVIYPLRGGELYNLVAVFHSNRYEEGWDSFGDPAELHERFAKTCEPVRTLLGKIESWRMWVLCDRPPVEELEQGPHDAHRRRRPSDAAIPRAGRLHGDRRRRLPRQPRRGPRKATSPRRSRPIRHARYLRTGRVQIMARVYGEFYHASGVARELRNMMLSRAHGRAVVRGDGVALRRGHEPDRLRARVPARRRAIRLQL